MDRRTIAWVSAGAASAIAAKLTLNDRPATLAYCETGAEHEDNARFLIELERWYSQPIERLKSDEYPDTWSVWEKRRYLSGISGAPCTMELKVKPRLAFQRPTDIHVFGYTNDKSDIDRARKLRENYPELAIETPLIERGLDKAACIALIQGAGINPPLTYALGFPNANCLPCVKATSPAYWALVRKHFPNKFNRMAKLSRELNVRLTRIKGARKFIDEIPLNFPVTNPIMPSCDFLCSVIEQEFDS